MSSCCCGAWPPIALDWISPVVAFASMPMCRGRGVFRSMAVVCSHHCCLSFGVPSLVCGPCSDAYVAVYVLALTMTMRLVGS